MGGRIDHLPDVDNLGRRTAADLDVLADVGLVLWVELAPALRLSWRRAATRGDAAERRRVSLDQCAKPWPPPIEWARTRPSMERSFGAGLPSSICQQGDGRRTRHSPYCSLCQPLSRPRGREGLGKAMSMRSRKDNGDPHLDLGADERVRDRIQKVMDLDVVVEIDPRAPPFCELPIVGGQGDEGVALDKSGRSRGTSEALGRIVRWPTTNNSRPPSTRDRCFAFLQSEFEENGAAHLRDALKARNFVGEIGGPFFTQSPCERTAATSDRVCSGEDSRWL